VYGFGPGFSSGGYGSPSYSIRVLGYEYAGVERFANALADQLRRIPRVRDVDPNAGSSWGSRDRAREVVLEPDRQALARAGLSAAEFAEAVGRQVAGAVGVIRLAIGGEELPVVLKAQGAETRSLDELEQALVTGTGGHAARVGGLARVGERQVLGDIVRENQQYRRILTYEFRGPQKLGDRVYKSVLASAAPPPGYALVEGRFWGGPEDDSSKALWLVFGIGVALVLIATATVYDSVWVTVMVLLGLPLAFAGVAGAFLVSDAAFTREAAVGVILVVGLAVNQVVVLADFVRRRRRSGVPRVAAALGGAREAAGVVLLTGVATIASLVPLAWGTALDTLFGAIALATAGGTVASTLAALFVLPLVMAGGPRRFRVAS
jgi:multidrug efflux pump subunit AcrB